MPNIATAAATAAATSTATSSATPARRAEGPGPAGDFTAALRSATQGPAPEARKAEPPRQGDVPPASREARPPAQGGPSTAVSEPPLATAPEGLPEDDDAAATQPPGTRPVRPPRGLLTLPPQGVIEPPVPSAPAAPRVEPNPAPTIAAIAPLPDAPPPAEAPIAVAPLGLDPLPAAPMPALPPAQAGWPRESNRNDEGETGGETAPRQGVPPLAPPQALQPIDTAPRAVAPPLPEIAPPTTPSRASAPDPASADAVALAEPTPATAVTAMPAPIGSEPVRAALPARPVEAAPPRAEAPAAAPPLSAMPGTMTPPAMPFASALPALAVPASPPLAMHQPGFADEVGTQVAIWTRQGIQHAELRLNPAELGPVQVRIRVDGEQAQIQFVAELAGTRDALQAALPELRQALAGEGLQMAGAEVRGEVRGDSRSETRADMGQGQRRDAPTPGMRARGGDADETIGAPTTARATGRRGLLDLYA